MLISDSNKQSLPDSKALLELPIGWSNWEELMDEAMLEAKKAQKLDEVPVGAIVVTVEGEIVGRGHNCPISSCNPVAHAEIKALEEAARNIGNYRLNQAFLVVTLEPCMMCAGAIVHSRLKGVIFGAYDGKSGAISSQIQTLDLPFHNHKTTCLGGIKQQQCGEILSSFFKQKRQRAMSL